MSIPSVKPIVLEPAAATGGSSRPGGEPGDFAAIARSVAAGDLVAARAALAGSTAATNPALAQSLDAGNLAAARLALAQLGADAFARGAGRTTLPHDALPRYVPPYVPAVPVAAAGAPDPAEAKATAAGHPPKPVITATSVVDVGAEPAIAGGAVVDDGAKVTSISGQSYSVADVLLALATGNAGSIPADVINLYGPGGARYDPAAIMDAYRQSDIGKAQMAALSWVGRPA